MNAVFVNRNFRQETREIPAPLPIIQLPVRQAAMSLAGVEDAGLQMHQHRVFVKDDRLKDGTLVYCERPKQAKRFRILWQYAALGESKADQLAEQELRHYIERRGFFRYEHVLEDITTILARPSEDNNFIGRKGRELLVVTV